MEGKSHLVTAEWGGNPSSSHGFHWGAGENTWVWWGNLITSWWGRKSQLSTWSFRTSLWSGCWGTTAAWTGKSWGSSLALCWCGCTTWKFYKNFIFRLPSHPNFRQTRITCLFLYFCINYLARRCGQSRNILSQSFCLPKLLLSWSVGWKEHVCRGKGGAFCCCCLRNTCISEFLSFRVPNPGHMRQKENPKNSPMSLSSVLRSQIIFLLCPPLRVFFYVCFTTVFSGV